MALEKGAGYIFQIDADRQTLPEEFAPFWECREQFDASIGLRSNRQDGLGRVFVTKVLGLSLQVMFGVDIPDANTPFRLLRRDVLAQALALVPDGHKLTNVLLSVVLTKQKRSINWLPITFRMRQGGVNSINFRRIFHIGLKSMYDFWRFREVLRNR